MLVQEYIEILIAADERGIFTDENRFQEGFMLNVLNSGRQAAIVELHKKHNIIHPNFYQQIELYAKDMVQEDKCMTTFRVPRTVRINGEVVTGMSYFGSIRGQRNWREIVSRSALANQRAKRTGNSQIDYLIEYSTGVAEVYKGGLTHAFMEGVMEDPLDPILNFNREFDHYPITMEASQMVENYVRTGLIRSVMQRPENATPNSVSDAAATAAPAS